MYIGQRTPFKINVLLYLLFLLIRAYIVHYKKTATVVQDYRNETTNVEKPNTVLTFIQSQLQNITINEWELQTCGGNSFSHKHSNAINDFKNTL